MTNNDIKNKAYQILKEHKPDGGNITPAEFDAIIDTLSSEENLTSETSRNYQHQNNISKNNDFLAKTAIELLKYSLILGPNLIIS